MTLTSGETAALDTLTEPALEYPMNVIRSFATGYQQGATTINGLVSTEFTRA